MTGKASKRYPGRISVLAAGIIIVFIGMAAAMGYLLIRNPSIEPLVRMIPDDAVGLAITRFSAADALELNAWEIASEIGKNHQEEVGAGFEKIKEYLGIDPSDKDALLACGVDLFKPMGFSVHMLSEEEAALAFYLPYNDRKGLGYG